MKKWTLALLGATTALALSGGTAMAATNVIYDPLTGVNGSPPPAAGTYSHGNASGNNGINGTNWKDAYNGNGGDDFYSGNITVGWVGDDVIIKLLTNMPQGGSPSSGTKYGMADLFFDTNGGTNWNFGVDINSGRADIDGGFGQTSSGGKVETIGAAQSVGPGTSARLVSTPQALKAVNGQIAWTQVCTDTGLSGGAGTDCDVAKARAPEVEVGTGTVKSNVVTISQTVLAASEPTDFLYTIVIKGVNTDDSWDDFRLFWGTGWCANDTVEGSVSIPVPAALPIIGAALAGFGFAGWRQRKAA